MPAKAGAKSGGCVRLPRMPQSEGAKEQAREAEGVAQTLPWPIRSLWLLALLGHAVAAAGWWWLMPGGFPIDHPRLYSNRVVPLLVLLAVMVAIALLRQRRPLPARLTLATLAGVWVGGGITALVLYPSSRRLLFVALLGAAGVMTLAALAGMARRHARYLLPALLAGGVAGLALMATQRGPTPSTRPGGSLDEAQAMATQPVVPYSNRLVRIDAQTPAVMLEDRPLRLAVYPMLTFDSRSADRFWTIFARRRDRLGPERRFLGAQVEGASRVLSYESDGPERLRVTPHESLPSALLEASFTLPEPVYSHLNSYLFAEVTGFESLSLAFSPCPDTPIEVRPFGYPFGAPARVAYLDASGMFRVVEARSGEKGPFRLLAEGELGDGPLTVTLLDEGRRVGEIVLHDWASQASTDLSPTAGWGLPQNAIEFFLSRHRSSTAALHVTLAGTSVGRGWDSVGHAAGTYTSRVTVSLDNAGEAASRLESAGDE